MKNLTKKLTVIRVGEKNNFNHTIEELKELEKWEKKGNVFVNSNGFTKITSKYPSFVTINPYMKFVPLKGDLSNVKAVRIKVYNTENLTDCEEMEKCIEFCVKNDLRILLTYMRYRKIETAVKYSGDNFRAWYEHKAGYFRATDQTKKDLLLWVKDEVEFNNGNIDTIFECDAAGKGCPECMNCSLLSFGTKNANIKALNLSVSGIKDKNGKQGLCPYQCVDCWSKIVCFGKSPACDRLLVNKKMSGNLHAKRKTAKKKINI